MSDQHSTGRAQTLTITLAQIRQLKGQKNDVVSAIVKFEFGERSLGETGKIECSSDHDTDVNYSTCINVNADDPLFLDDLANKPVICTVVEVLPKEKKQKEEKSVTLGQCSIDLLPLFSGDLKHKVTVPICAVPGSPLETLSPEQPKPEMDVILSINEPMLSETQIESGNIASITVGSLYSPPESWSVANSAGFTYIAALPLPLSAERENLAVFAGGQLRPGAEKEVPNRRRRWAVPGGAQGGATYIGEKLISSDPIEDETGELKSKEDQEFRQASELNKLRVTWNIERRCYIDGSGLKSLREKIAKNRYWPVEVFRTVSAAGAGVKGRAREEEGISFHGLTYVDMSPLIYPGVKRISGAYPVIAFNGSELSEKTGRGFSMADDAARIATSILTRNSSPGPKVTKKDDTNKAPAKAPKAPSVNKTLAPDELAPVNPDDIQYNEAKSYIMLEICLDRPLVPKRQPEELAKQVAELIPPRPLFPRRTNCAEKAVEEFHGQVSKIATKLLEEFREQFGDSGFYHRQSTQFDAVEEKRQRLIYHLNTSGKYMAFKEQLKYSVVKIVREKFLKTTSFSDNNELQAFLSELYVYLVDEMHVGLNKTLSVEDQVPVPEPLTDSVQLKHFAREAEVNGRIDLAARFYQERIARSKADADAWLDYGTFNLYINDLTKAEECFKECVSVDQRHLHGLLLNGVVCTMQDKNDLAEVFFEAAVTYQPQSILAWTMFGLFYDAIGNEIGAEMALGEANKLNVAAAVAAAKALSEEPIADQHLVADGDELVDDNKERMPHDEIRIAKGPKEVAAAVVTEQEVQTPEPPPVVPAETIFMQIVEFLLDVKAMPFTERALSHHLLDPNGGYSNRYHIVLAQLYLQKHEMDKAEQEIQAALQMEYENPDAWAILGHIKYLSGDSETAKSCYERTLSFIGDPSEMHSIYLRLASIYLQEGQFQKARDVFLKSCQKSPSCVSWLGVGIACYRLGELSDAEAALTEANILYNLDPEVWAYLCLICLQTGRQVEAEQAYKYTVKLNLEDQELLAEIHELQERVGFGNPSF